MVKFGSVELSGSGLPLPRERVRAKRTLKSIAYTCGVKKVYFVRTTKAFYGGLYDRRSRKIIVVEQEGTRQIPMWFVTWRFFHELTHHLHQEGGLFSAYYLTEVKINGKRKRYTKKDRRRVALRAERHANQRACDLAQEFFGLVMEPPEYSREFLVKSQNFFNQSL